MARVRTRIDPIDRDIAVMISGDLSAEEQGRVRARFAREALEDAQEANRRVLGMVPLHDTFVDRVKGAPLESVKPDGTILFEFRLLDDALTWISEQLVRHAPFRTGRYAASFDLFVDGALVDIVNPPATFSEAVFLNSQPYSRKIEMGQSPQAPDGVFEAVAVLAQRRFGNTARIGFDWRSPIYISGGKNRSERVVERQSRTPAIIVRPHGQQGSR